MLLSAHSPHHQHQQLQHNKENSQPRRASARHRSSTSTKLLLSSAIPKSIRPTSSSRSTTSSPKLNTRHLTSSGSPYARPPSTPPASPKKKSSKGLPSSLARPRTRHVEEGLVHAPSSSSSRLPPQPSMDQQHYAASGSRGPVVMDRAEGGSAFLPLSLPRPERIAQIDVPTVEELEGVPYPYILERLAQSGPSLLQSALTSKLAHGSTTLTPPLPTSLLFDFTPASSLNPLTQLPSPPPNYVLAIRPTPTGPNGSSSGAGSILPIHDIIYRTFCAHLPPIPPRAHDLPENALPIISITLPSPGTLPTLNTYLYTQRPDILLSTLLALPSQAGTSRTRADLTNQLASVLNVPELMQRISLVHGVWGNVCALGVADALLWKALDTSWEVLVGAVALRQEMREE